LAWNRVLALYLPLTMFALWFNVVTYSVAKAIKSQSVEFASGPSIPGRPDGGQTFLDAARLETPSAASDLGDRSTTLDVTQTVSGRQ
jgi:hypothetical protein